MAEQNRKTSEQVLWRIRAEQLVDSYLDYLFADSDSEIIAKEGLSLLGIYSEHGSLPRSPGFAGFCKLAGVVDRMRMRYATEAMLAARRKMIMLDDDYINALCIDRCYRGRIKVAVDPFTEQRFEIVWDDFRCASLLGISQEAMRKRISRGYRALEDALRPSKQTA